MTTRLDSPRPDHTLTTQARPVPALAVITGVLAVPVLLYAAVIAWWTAQGMATNSDADPLAGLGYIVAGLAAVPALTALLLAVSGYLARTRYPRSALVSAVLGLVAVSVPASVLAFGALSAL